LEKVEKLRQQIFQKLGVGYIVEAGGTIINVKTVDTYHTISHFSIFVYEDRLTLYLDSERRIPLLEEFCGLDLSQNCQLEKLLGTYCALTEASIAVYFQDLARKKAKQEREKLIRPVKLWAPWVIGLLFVLGFLLQF
jgi:hypothetical protein